MSYSPTTRPTVLAANTGHHLHFLNHLATIKVAPGDGGSLAAVEFLAPRGLGPPLHRHQHEDELFIVLAGEIEVRCGDETFVAEEGAFAHLPHGIPHTFQVLSDTARFAAITASNAGAPRFDQMVIALGAAVDRPYLPDPGPIDPSRVADVCREYGIDVLGPPPAPLD